MAFGTVAQRVPTAGRGAELGRGWGLPGPRPLLHCLACSEAICAQGERGNGGFPVSESFHLLSKRSERRAEKYWAGHQRI